MASSTSTSRHVNRLIDYLENGEDIATLVDLRSVFPATFSPPPSVLKIAMDEPFDVAKFKENIVFVLRRNNAELSVRTWRRMLVFFKSPEATVSDRATQLKYEALLVMSKVDRKELYSSRPPKYINSPGATIYYDERMAELLAVLRGNIPLFHLNQMDTATLVRLKEFMKQRAVVNAMVFCLNDVLGQGKCDETWVSNEIDGMTIFFTDQLGSLCGMAVRDGILLIGVNIERTFPSRPLAQVFTLCCHETIHFLVRRLDNNYNFDTPFISISEVAPPRMDPIIEGKNLELGRFLEITLFDQIQPDWSESSHEAAIEFIARSHLRSNFPLFNRSEHSQFGLVARKHPSVSFGGEFIYWDTTPLLIG